MKSIVKILLLVCITTISYAQNKTKNKEKTKRVNLPEVVINSERENNSVYIRDFNVDPKVTNLENSLLKYVLDKNLDGNETDTYRVNFNLKNGDGKLCAIYTKKGNLISVIENYKNLVLPNSVSNAVYKEYPGWQIDTDKYNYSQENGEITKKEYKLTLTKDNKRLKIVVNPVGEILASR